MADTANSLPVRTENPGDVAVKISDKTITTQQLAVDVNGNASVNVQNAPAVKLEDGSGNAITSTGNALDVNLKSGTPGVVDKSTFTYGTSNELPVGGVFQDTSPALTAGQTGVNRMTAQRGLHSNLRDSSGNELLGQKAMAASVPVALASDQSAIPVNQGTPVAIANAWPVKPTDGTNTQSFTALGEVKASVTQPLPAGTNNIGKTSIQDSSGNPFTTANPLFVTVSGEPGNEVNDYNTVASVVAGATSNHDYAITSGKTFKGRKIHASSSGKLKIEVQVSPDGTTFTSKFVSFNSVAKPDIDLDLGVLTFTETGTGSKIRVIRTNLEKSNSEDVYSTISGIEI